ncbi:MAG: hypothetical protein CL429_02640 [Acidimicrobiaceae bacterium]|nr:hypothetical protein [Acidimicrobiaceae bacterium]
MTFNVPIDYYVPKQEEVVVEINLTDLQVKAIVQDHINRMDYKERQAWIKKQGVKVKRRII